MTTIDNLKIQLKIWEHEFFESNGRSPTKDDIKNDVEIKRKYKEYASLKKRLGASKPPSIDATPSQKDAHTELGPTPQIYGKVFSLFEMNISPATRSTPKRVSSTLSSPLKSTISIPPVELDKPVRRQLNFASLGKESPSKPLAASTIPTLAPPTGSGGNQTIYGPNSPVKFDKELLVKLARTPMHAETMNLGTHTSPSPLIKRPAKSLSQLAREHHEIVQEMHSLGEQNTVRKLDELLQQEVIAEEEQADTTNDPIPTRKPRKKTIKVALKMIDEEDIPKENVHEQVAKAKQRALDEYRGLETEDVSTERPTSIVQPKKVTKPRKKKYNTLTDNFVRLKLPRGNRGGSRWRRK